MAGDQKLGGFGLKRGEKICGRVGALIGYSDGEDEANRPRAARWRDCIHMR